MPVKSFVNVAALAAVASSFSLTSAAHAQWTVTVLHPSDSSESRAQAASAGRQAGYAVVGDVTRASLWSGTAASWVDLHPAGATESAAVAASGTQQAGYVVVDRVNRASLWSGTAASWVDLHPAGATQSSVYAASGGQQAGYVEVGGVTRASLWSGTAASWVDLHPADAGQSQVQAISGGQQAGTAWVGAVVSASLWSGTAASWVDLSMFLPAEFSSSQATGISSDGVNVYVTGYGLNWITGRTEALLWTRAIPGPAACNLADLTGIGGPPSEPDGLITGDDFNAFIAAFAAGCP
ncbi:MAG: GC-type dockerin domain-anchored protein [bacterium]